MTNPNSNSNSNSNSNRSMMLPPNSSLTPAEEEEFNRLDAKRARVGKVTMKELMRMCELASKAGLMEPYGTDRKGRTLYRLTDGAKAWLARGEKPLH